MSSAHPVPVSMEHAVVIVPTYNEAENIERAIAAIRSASPDIHILIVDDSSPDGTGQIVDRLAQGDARLSVLHHGDRGGLGAAYLAGFERALDDGYTVLIEMDADGSHPAAALPAMVSRLDDPDHADLVIGSRWITGGGFVDWPASRRVLSRAGNAYTRLALGIQVRDATAGFRAYRAAALRTLDLDGVESRGYCFQIDMTRRVLDAGYVVAEVPIVFRDRRHGASKMSTAIVAEAMLRVTVWGLARRFGRRTGRRPALTRPADPVE
ncbi:polyprenol monophosphomannose synthase [Lysinimonas soli]|uniref:Polyprenol monophosphomannose synthase n=1 Tax=Lysinimonas soli TaxID=1074233 RepID=A0ABW0NVY7_9MICO